MRTAFQSPASAGVHSFSAGVAGIAHSGDGCRTSSDNAVLFERGYLSGRQFEPVAVDLTVVLAELRAGHGVDRVGAVEAQRRRRHDDAADLIVLDPFEHATLVHV